MAPWPPASPMPWLQEELPTGGKQRDLLEWSKQCHRKLTPHRSLSCSSSGLQRGLSSLHLLYHLKLMTAPQEGMITPVLQRRNSRPENTGVHTSSFSLQSPCFSQWAGLPSLQNIEIWCLSKNNLTLQLLHLISTPFWVCIFLFFCLGMTNPKLF